VLSDSEKASAALSRRCLEHLLREKAGVKQDDLRATSFARLLMCVGRCTTQRAVRSGPGGQSHRALGRGRR